MQYVFNTANTRRYKFPTHINDLVMDRAEATVSEVFVVIIEPGKAPPLHKHDDTEQIFYVLAGEGTLTIGKQGENYPVKVGDLVRVPPSTFHTIKAESGSELRYLAVDCFTAARSDEEPTWEDHVKVLCRQQGWDYKQVVS